MERLVSLGILEPREGKNGEFTKKVLDLGAEEDTDERTPLSFECHVMEPLRSEDKENLALETDWRNREALKRFVRHHLLIEIRSSRYEYGLEQLEVWENNPDPLIDAIVGYLENMMKTIKPECLMDGKNYYFGGLYKTIEIFWERAVQTQQITGTINFSAISAWASGIGQAMFNALQTQSDAAKRSA